MSTAPTLSAIIPVIINGASGRMGSTLVQAARAQSDMRLAGVTERAEKLDAVSALGCPHSADIGDLLAETPGAVVIDFTAPEASLAVAAQAARHGACHVVGATAFSKEQIARLARLAEKTPIFWSPNMSVGVSALSRILPELARLLGAAYDIEMSEIHHRHKKDSPSGTALRLAEGLADARGWSLAETACYHREGLVGERPEKEIGIQTLRGGDVVGVHTVYFMGPGERIEISHQAHSRENFAGGALRAARWLRGRAPGRLYGMEDLL